MGTHPIFESDFDCLTEWKMAQSDKRSLKYDDFKWGKALGEGSFGEVVQAELNDNAKEHYKYKEQFFAVKRLSISFLNKEQMIKERTGRDVIKQVFTEKEILLKLKSDFVIKLFGTFKTTDEIFFVLSYQDKGDLRDLLNEKAALDVSTAQFYSAELFSALFYLHENNIIHRDIKPENILLHEYENGIHLKLCDFATAKDLSTLENGQRPRTFVGSAEYVSPELLGFDKEIGKYTCFESDLWAAACITYFMLSGLPPFQAQSEYLVFQKIEKLEYNFPSGFHPSGKSFISSLLRLKPQDRLGSNRADSNIKNHIFFNKIAWANLYQQIAPPIKQYLPPSEDSSSLDGALEPIAINQAADNQSPDCNRSAIDDASGQGIPFVLPKDEYDSLLKDQSVNRKNVAHKWKDFVENELIIKMGYMEKKRGFFPRKRMFLLTGGKRDVTPRFVYVDATEWTKKGEISFHDKVTLEQKSFSRFYIIDPLKGRSGRTYDLTDKNSSSDINAGAIQWITKIKKLQNIYFPSQ